MVELTRTLRQWWATARHLEQREIGRPDLAEQIRWAFPVDRSAHLDTPVTVRLIEEDAAVIEDRAPLSAWWMPTVPGWSLRRRSTVGSAADAVAAAEAIIVAHQRGRPPR